MSKLADTESAAHEFETYLRPILGAAYGTALHMTRHRDDAEDLVQEASLQAFRGFHSFEPGFPFCLPGQPSVYTQLPPLGPFFHPFHPKRLRRPTKGLARPLPGTGNPEMASFSSNFLDTSPSPPSFARFGSPSAPHPIRLAPAKPQSAAPCFQRAAASGGSLPTAASSSERA